MILNDLKLLSSSGQCLGVEHKFCKAPEISEGRDMYGWVIPGADRKRGRASEHGSPFAAIKLGHQSWMGKNHLCAPSVPWKMCR